MMKLAFACLAVVLLASDVLAREVKSKPKPKKKSVAEIIKASGIVPDLLDEAPTKKLGVEYEDFVVNLGNEAYPSQTIGTPTITTTLVEGCKGIIIVVDIDAPSKATPYWRSYLMGLYVNVVDGDLEDADEIATLLPASPVPGTGLHRIVYLEFKQPDGFNCEADELEKYQVDRLAFNVTEFIDKYGICTESIAINYLVTQFPDDIKALCEELAEEEEEEKYKYKKY